MQLHLRERIADWIYRAKAPETPPVVLVQRRIYIVPTRHGYLFAFILVLLLLASINYQISLGYLLVFLLASIGGTGMLHTWRNLAQLSLAPGRVEPVFAGDTAQFTLRLGDTTLPRFSVAVRRSQGEAEYADVPQAGTATVALPVAAEKRGWLSLGRLEIFTHYPFGLFHAWSYVDFGTRCLVYPRPDPGAGPLPVEASQHGDGTSMIPGEDEFHALRGWRPTDSPRHIAWKALAREQGLLSKEFMSTASSDLWLAWEHFPSLGTEERLSKLTFWVLEADRLGLAWGLKLPGVNIPLNGGDAHRLACLEALALFQIGPAAA
ncbi:MAG: DUF58 domain-containing protein [Betaproteobacteria bacterium]|nr:DUF58 domain-containing protein [Betaproteobacteria bacterium]